MTPQRFTRLRAVLERRQPDLTVLMDNVHKPHNFSAVLRSCDAVGALEAHGVWPDAGVRPSNPSSGGARRWVRVRRHRSFDGAADHLHQRGFRIVAAHRSLRSVDYRTLDYTAATAFLLGAELDGVSEASALRADAHAEIPMHGMAESLNVSVAAALLLFEAERQRIAAGMYRRRRLDDESWRRTLFEWSHPRIAEYCRRHGREYPALDDDGRIVEEFRVPIDAG